MLENTFCACWDIFHFISFMIRQCSIRILGLLRLPNSNEAGACVGLTVLPMIRCPQTSAASLRRETPAHSALSAAQSRDSLLDVRLVVSLLGRLEVVAGNEVGDVIIILIVVLTLTLLLLHALVALGKLAQRCERVRAELVKDTGDELGELLVLTDTVDGEGVGGYRGVNCRVIVSTCTASRARRGWSGRFHVHRHMRPFIHVKPDTVLPTPS